MGNPLEEEVEVGEEQFRHNWMYSFCPGTVEGEIGIYLTGYDKVCRQAFTVRLPVDAKEGYAAIQEVDIPRWGCVDPVKQFEV